MTSAPSSLTLLKKELGLSGKPFVRIAEEENNDEFVHFMFVGLLDGTEVVCDAIVYTLRLQHETEIYDLAEREVIKQFPQYESYIASGEEGGGRIPSAEIAGEIGMRMAEAVLTFEEEQAVKVSEHVDIDTEQGDTVGFEAGLRVEKITDGLIGNLIRMFNDNTLVLDETLVSYETGEEE